MPLRREACHFKKEIPSRQSFPFCTLKRTSRPVSPIQVRPRLPSATAHGACMPIGLHIGHVMKHPIRAQRSACIFVLSLKYPYMTIGFSQFRLIVSDANASFLWVLSFVAPLSNILLPHYHIVRTVCHGYQIPQSSWTLPFVPYFALVYQCGASFFPDSIVEGKPQL